MKKLTAFALALLLALTLCACGGSDKDQALLGTYKLYAMDYEDSVLFADEFFSGENYVTLKSGGKAELCMEDEKADVKWKLDGTKLTVTADDGDIDGSLKDGIVTLVFDGSNLYFLGSGADKSKLKAVTLEELVGGLVNNVDLPGTTDAPETDAPAQTEVQKMWNGWWYGCADINGCEGGWEFANGMTFDSAMYVELDADGFGTFGIYDPYGEMAQGDNNNRFITVNCHADLNYLYGDSGTEYGYEIDPKNWVFVHNLDNPNKLNVGSSYTDEAGNKMGYDFTFLPWGDRWEGETYQQFIPHFEEYLAKLDEGWTDPFGFGGGSGETPDTPSGGETPSTPSDGGSGGRSPLLGSSPAKLDVNDRGIVSVYYPADQFVYDDVWEKLKNEASGVGILPDPMLGSTNLDELKASYELSNSGQDDYSLTETTLCGYRALVLKYSDWLGANMRVDIDFGGSHDGWYGISFSVTGDTLEDCDSELVWAIIGSMEVTK